jgi:hypothetical protein
VDARLHQLQGKTKRVTATQLVEFLREFYRDKLAMRQKHSDAARSVGNYDFNNTYQYILAREDLQLNWLREALTKMGATVEEAASPAAGDVSEPGHDARSHHGVQAERSAIESDRDAAQAFVDKWSPRLGALPNARHRTMLRVILGETLEHKRFFDQALAGRSDLLGRRADGAGTGGGVLSTRWVE